VEKGTRGAGEAAKMLEDVTVGNIQRARVAKAGERAKSIPDTAYDPLRERLEAQGSLALAVPQGPTQVSTASFSPLPTANAPFVGRLDQFAAGMQSPMKKDQLLGMLSKGKFKDYEVERARVALQDLPDDAKVMPTDFLNRLNNVYNPAGYRTTITEPKGGNAFFAGNDNILGAGEGAPPMGVIHLSKFIDPVTEQAAELSKDASSDLYRLSKGGSEFLGNNAMPLDSVLRWADTQPDGPNIKNLLNSEPVMRAKEANNSRDKAQEAFDKIVFPRWESVPFPYKEDGRVDFVKYEDLKREQAQKIRQEGKDVWAQLRVNAELPPDPPGLDPIMPYADTQYKRQLLDALKGYREEMRKVAQNAVVPVLDDLADLRERIQEGSMYMGQHKSLDNPPMPIAFSRFTEHTANVPGMGEIKGIWVRELQSDMLDDIRKVGKKGGSETKDYQELKEVETKLSSRFGLPDSEIYSLLGREKVLKERLDKSRSSEVSPYSLEEVFPGMETSPQVAQQLMAKNAVNGALQRGAQFVAFPGKESDQAQLYEKLPRNLDAVVKDLGPGFERRTIDIPLPSGETASFNAIVWSPEAAQKLQKSGIPFAKGGMVERNNHDNRAYK